MIFKKKHSLSKIEILKMATALCTLSSNHSCNHQLKHPSYRAARCKNTLRNFPLAGYRQASISATASASKRYGTSLIHRMAPEVHANRAKGWLPDRADLSHRSEGTGGERYCAYHPIGLGWGAGHSLKSGTQLLLVFSVSPLFQEESAGT